MKRHASSSDAASSQDEQHRSSAEEHSHGSDEDDKEDSYDEYMEQARERKRKRRRVQEEERTRERVNQGATIEEGDFVLFGESAVCIWNPALCMDKEATEYILKKARASSPFLSHPDTRGHRLLTRGAGSRG